MNRMSMIAALGLIGFSVINVANAGQWTGWGDADRIYSHSQSYLSYLTPAELHINPDECPRARPYKFDRSQENSKEIFQMLLTAKLSGFKVRAYLSECVGSYPRILYLEVK